MSPVPIVVVQARKDVHHGQEHPVRLLFSQVVEPLHLVICCLVFFKVVWIFYIPKDRVDADDSKLSSWYVIRVIATLKKSLLDVFHLFCG